MFDEASVNGGSFTPSGCNSGITSSGVFIDPDAVASFVYRTSWVTDCTSQTVIQQFTSVVLGGCPPPPGASPDTGTTPPQITTRRDGDTITVTISES